MLDIIFLGGEDVSARIDIVEVLNQKECNVTILGSEDRTIFDSHQISYKNIHINRELNILDDIKTIFEIRRVLKKTKNTTIVHAFDTKLIIYLPFAALGLRNIKTVRTINGMGRIFSGDSFKNKILQGIYIFIQKLIKNRVDYTIFQNTDNYKFFEKRNMVNRASCKVVRGSGINLKKFQSSISEKEELAKTLDINMRIPTIILVSRLIRQKGVLEYLEAAKLINEKNQEANFLLVGQIDTNQDAISINEIENYSPYVNYLGRRNDIRALLSICDIFVLPSYYSEGVPRVLLEAAAMKLALLTTDMPGCNDVVVDGFNGKIINIKDTLDLVNKLRLVMSDKDELQTMKINSSIHVQQFSLDNVASEYFNIYKDLINKQL